MLELLAGFLLMGGYAATCIFVTRRIGWTD